MANWFIYLTKGGIFLLALWMLYRILLGRTTFFRLQRLVLTGGTAACLLLPFVQMETKHDSPLQQPLAALNKALEETRLLPADTKREEKGINATDITLIHATEPAGAYTVGTSHTSHEKETLPLSWLLPAIYLCGCAFVLSRRAIGYLHLGMLISRADKIREKGTTWCLTDEEVCPCNWGHYVLIPRKKYSGDSLIALHERRHVEHRHYADMLFMQVLTTVFWFHPAAWFLMRDLKQCHEFQVDRDMCRLSAPLQYQLLLVREAVGAKLFAMASGFSGPRLKKRIDMMQRKESSRWRMWLTLLFIPAGTGLVYAFSQPENNKKIAHFVKMEKELQPTPTKENTKAEPITETPTPTPAISQETTPDATETQQVEPPKTEVSDGKVWHPEIEMHKLTGSEYHRCKEQNLFITIYVDVPDQFRLQDCEGTVHPTAQHSLDGDVAVLLREAFSRRYLSHTVPYVPGIRIVAPANIPDTPLAMVEVKLYSAFKYSAKEMESRYPDADMSSLRIPNVYWDVPGLEVSIPTREDYRHQYKGFKIVFHDENQKERIQLTDFTGKELEEAIERCLQETPDTRLTLKGIGYCGKENARTYKLFFLILNEVWDKYQLSGHVMNFYKSHRKESFRTSISFEYL